MFSRPVLIGRGLDRTFNVNTKNVRARYGVLEGSHDTIISGGHGGGVTPVPIPNTAVKPARADGTWGETPWESRTPPDCSWRSALTSVGALVRVPAPTRLLDASASGPVNAGIRAQSSSVLDA